MSRAGGATTSSAFEASEPHTEAPLAERPPISRPDEPRKRAPAGDLRQPWLGLAGLSLVVPIAVVLAAGAGSDASVLVVGPLVTYALPLVAMVAFWWEDWPGTRLRRSWSGWVDTALIAIGAVVLTGIGQVVAGGLDVAALFDPTPGPGHVPTSPATLPLAGAAFVVMLQLTLVGEGWPLRRLPRLTAGVAALVVAWTVALVVVLALVEIRAPAGSNVVARDGPVPAAEFGAALVVISAWQVLFYVVWRGWPLSSIGSRARRLTGAHVAVLGSAAVTFLLTRDVMGIGEGRLTAIAGCFAAGGLLSGMLLEGWPGRRPADGTTRVATLLVTLLVTALLLVVLDAIGDRLPFTRATTDEWVAHAALSSLAVSIILHVAIGRRWPFTGRDDGNGADAAI
jgi:hypothetical protein